MVEGPRLKAVLRGSQQGALPAAQPPAFPAAAAAAGAQGPPQPPSSLPRLVSGSFSFWRGHQIGEGVGEKEGPLRWAAPLGEA